MSSVTISSGTPEEVAFKLWWEMKSFGQPDNVEKALKLYAQCLITVKNPIKAIDASATAVGQGKVHY